MHGALATRPLAVARDGGAAGMARHDKTHRHEVALSAPGLDPDRGLGLLARRDLCQCGEEIELAAVDMTQAQRVPADPDQEVGAACDDLLQVTSLGIDAVAKGNVTRLEAEACEALARPAFAQLHTDQPLSRQFV